MSDLARQSLPFTYAPVSDTRLLIREVTPEDRFLIERGFDQLSAQSRFFRFMSAHPNLSEAELNRFAASGDADHCAIGAVMADTDPVEPVAIARYIRLGDQPDMAEIAVTVIDRYQGLGIGRLMVRVLAAQAAARGLMGFVAYMHPGNAAMIGLLRHLGATRIDGLPGEVEMHLSLDGAARAAA